MRVISICCSWVLLIGAWAQEAQVIKPELSDPKARALQPYWATYRETLQMGDQKGESRRVTQLQALQLPEGPGWQETIYMISTDTVTDEWRFLQKNYQPVTRIVSARSMVHKIEVFGEKVAGVTVNAEGENPTPVSLAMKGARFPGTSWLYALARRELLLGQKYVLPIFSSDMGAAHANLLIQAEILGREKVRAVSGTSFEAWVLENTFLDQEHQPMRMGEQPFPKSKIWLISEPPYVVKTLWPNREILLDRFTPLPQFSSK